MSENPSTCDFESQLSKVKEDISLSIPIWDLNEDELPQFKVTQKRLANIHEEFGGILELVDALESDIDKGITGDSIDLYRRRKIFGSNEVFDEKAQFPIIEKCFYGLPFESFKDTTIILLLCCAMLSLVIGIKRNGPQEGFFDGLLIFLAIFIIVNFNSVGKYCKAKWLNKKISRVDQNVVVVRNGAMQQIEVSEIVVGDILCLETGNQVPVDGLFIQGESLNLDNNLDQEGCKFHMYPSLFHGQEVVQGYCHMLVTAVGNNTEKNKLMKSTNRSQNENSKLQIEIDKMNSKLENIWLSLSLLVLIVQVFRCFVWESGCDENHNPDPKGVKNTVEEIMTEATKIIRKKGIPVNRLVSVLFILVFSLRNGLPLGIFISLAYASRQIMSRGPIVQKLEASATIGSATTICINITNDLTLQPSEMAELWVGFERVEDVPKDIPIQMLKTLREGVGFNISDSGEFALSFWAKRVLGINIEEMKQSYMIFCAEDLEQEKNLSGLCLRRNDEDEKLLVHVHWRGVPEAVLSMCKYYYNNEGTMQTLDDQTRAKFHQMIEIFGSNSYQCIGFAYKQVSLQERENSGTLEEKEESDMAPQHGLTLLGLVCLKNPYSTKVKEEIKICKGLGVKIKLLVGDDINTARFMAINSGILEPQEIQMNGTVIEATEFRNGSKEERMILIEKFHVMANCTPYDRLTVVQCLREKGEVVAATGKSSRELATLKEADIGIFQGENEVSKESSDIIFPNMNFGTLSLILKLGGCVFKNLQKFIQLQLTINISAFTINLIIALLSSEVPLGPFELLWVNMVMDIFGALALGELGEESQLSHIHKPRQGLISKSMWANIVIQSLYQVIVLLTLNFTGKRILKEDQKVLEAMVFNSFVFCQVFAMINAREIDKKNVFKGIIKNKKNCPLIVLVLAIVVLQLVAIESASAVTHFGHFKVRQWCICIGIAAFSLPLGWIFKWFSLTYKL